MESRQPAAGPPRLVQYWFSTASPWAWLGSRRFAELSERTGAIVEVMPVDLGQVFAATGGALFSQRSTARQSYRQLELQRWSRRLGVPICLEPRHYPVDREPSSKLIIAARQRGLDALPLSHAVLQAIWSQDRNIADWNTLEAVTQSAGYDGRALVLEAQQPAMREQYLADTRRAVDAGVFGSPTFILNGERFWGQDRLDFLAERLVEPDVE